jgi:hypothetical protein
MKSRCASMMCRRGPNDANQQIVVGSVRLCRSDELEKLRVIRSNLLVRRQRAGAENRAQATGEFVRELEARDELGLRLREERDWVRGELVDEVESDASVADRLADRFEGDAGGGEREHEAYAPNVARPKTAVLRRDDTELAQLLDRLLRRATRDRDLGDAQLPHASNRSQAFEELAPGFGIRLVERAGA